MAKIKFYAVKKGRKPGIYKTWEKTESQVKGFSGAEYKSFETIEEADEYMKNASEAPMGEVLATSEEANNLIEKQIKELDDDSVLAFVDGSFSDKTSDQRPKCSYGVILFTKNSENRLYKSFEDTEGLESRNVSGELAGAKAAITWSLEQKKSKITIFYDYEGIEKWANGEWKTKKTLTKEYVDFINKNSDKIVIDFQHTPGHNGIIYNEQADALAKAALNDKTYRTGSDGSVYIVSISMERWKELLKEQKAAIQEENSDVGELKFSIIDVKENHKRIKITLGGDKVIINHYHEISSYIQGKPNTLLFNKILAIVIDEVDDENKVVDVLNVYHALTLSADEVEREFQRKLPNYKENIADIKHKNVLLTAVYNTLLTGYMPDYTHLLHPVFRSMEYYLHRILKDKEDKQTIIVKKTGGNQNKFSFFDFDGNNRSYVYNSNSNLNTDQEDYLNRLYNKYQQVRHPYSHYPDNEPDASVITSMTDARNLILDSLKLFDEYYILF